MDHQGATLPRSSIRRSHFLSATVRSKASLHPGAAPRTARRAMAWRKPFVHTFKRDRVDGAEVRGAETVLGQLAGWFEDYNTCAAHSAFGMQSLAEYRAEVTLDSSR